MAGVEAGVFGAARDEAGFGDGDGGVARQEIAGRRAQVRGRVGVGAWGRDEVGRGRGGADRDMGGFDIADVSVELGLAPEKAVRFVEDQEALAVVAERVEFGCR